MTSNSDFERTRITTSPESTRTGDRSAAERASDKANETRDRAGQKADEMKDRAGQKIDEMKDRAGEMRDRASEKGREANDRADSAMTNAGDRMHGLAETLRQRAPEGQAGNMAHDAARMLERSGTYLQRSNPQTVRSDLEQVIRDHPMESLAFGLGLGFILSKSMKSGRR
ncbi:MAG: YtxH domain-containing protein [Oscillochloris sp.]|nr:YtxH domain-containing protein [Oscillochloris sp.]